MSAHRRRVGALVFGMFGALLAAPGVAFAADGPPPPPAVSAVSQYVEVIPTGTGGTASGIGKQRSTAIPERIHALITRQGGRDAAKLAAIASSSAYGAPQRRAHPRPELPQPSRSVLSTAITASGTGSHTVWLLAILAATTIAAFVAAGMRRRARRY